MSLGTFNGHVFTDLSSFVPDQRDAILYTNAWNGQYWLVGGGYKQNGVLFTFNGSRFVDLTAQAESKISSFASVQSVGWNGSDWLIGGVGFLAEYDGHTLHRFNPATRTYSLEPDSIRKRDRMERSIMDDWGRNPCSPTNPKSCLGRILHFHRSR